MNKVTITAATLERLRTHSLDDGIAFGEPDADGLATIEISDDVLDRLNDAWPSDDGIQSDEDIDAAINFLLDENEQKGPSLH